MHARSTPLPHTVGLRYAFQPIVGVHSGEAYGFEALLRGTAQRGHASIGRFFETVTEAGDAVDVELELLENAVTEFALFSRATPARLFFNANARAYDDPRLRMQQVRDVFARAGLPIERLCLEISEAQTLPASAIAKIRSGRADDPLLAIDDFGCGNAGLRLLADVRPTIVKIDRIYIDGLDRDRDKQAFVTHLVALAHALGVMVVAEGVETIGEFMHCRDLGCDFVQGYLVARPTEAISELLPSYAIVEQLVARGHRRGGGVNALRDAIDHVESIPIDATMSDVLAAFQNDHARSFFPVVGSALEPLGIIHEYRLKSLIYSPFGRQILTSVVSPQALRDYVDPALSFDVRTNIDLVLGAIAQRPDAPTILVTENERYIGLLDTAAIIKTMHERLLAGARDANPLTKLPGNVRVTEFMLAALEGNALPAGFVYLDFDHFKPFNDRFGFRQGDRALVMFAEALRRTFADDVFLGHIGGDDFFVGTTGPATAKTIGALPDFLERFARDMESFYDEDARRAGWTTAVDRAGVTQRIPLLSVSGAGIVLRSRAPASALDAISARLATLKLRAKTAKTKFEIEALTTR